MGVLDATERERRGLWLGLLGVVIFAMTLPMTRLAVGNIQDPRLPPFFMTAGRAAGAGVLSLVWLLAQQAAWPKREQLAALGISAVGTVLGFPLFLALALRQAPAMHAAVVTGVLPLATAVMAALWLRQRPSFGFWLCALLGSGLVVTFALREGGGITVADLLLLGAVLSAAVGYVAGAHLAAQMGAKRVICWVLVLSLPLTVPASLLSWPAQPARVSAWLGFFAWYRGLAWGGAVRVSQVQLLQPFLALVFAVPVLGEPLEAATVGFSLAVMATVLVGRGMPVASARVVS